MSADLQDRADGVLYEPDADAQHEFTETAPTLSPLLMSKHSKSQSVRRARHQFQLRVSAVSAVFSSRARSFIRFLKF